MLAARHAQMDMRIDQTRQNDLCYLFHLAVKSLSTIPVIEYQSLLGNTKQAKKNPQAGVEKMRALLTGSCRAALMQLESLMNFSIYVAANCSVYTIYGYACKGFFLILHLIPNI